MNFGEIFEAYKTEIFLYGFSVLGTLLLLIIVVLVHERIADSWRDEKLERYLPDDEYDDDDEEYY